MLKALIFDFDGVLVSSEEPRFKALKEIAGRHGVKIDEAVKHFARGKTTQRVLEHVIRDNKELINTILSDFMREYRDHITDYVQPINFTVNFIRNYAGPLPIAIASMSSKETIKRLTTHFCIYEKIACIVGKDEVVNHKPDPEIYLKTASALNVAPENCLAFEDTDIGVRSAIAAQMSCCVVLNGQNNRQEFAGLPIRSFIESQTDLEALDLV